MLYKLRYEFFFSVLFIFYKNVLQATPSVKAVIGKWVIQLNLINRSTKTSHAHSTNPIYVLFNPWSKG